MTEEEVLYAAFHSEIGIEVEIHGNAQTALMRLYSTKRKDPDLEILQISKKPGDAMASQVYWIVKRDKREPVEPPQALKQNPQGDGPLFSLADLLGDE